MFLINKSAGKVVKYSCVSLILNVTFPPKAAEKGTSKIFLFEKVHEVWRSESFLTWKSAPSWCV